MPTRLIIYTFILLRLSHCLLCLPRSITISISLCYTCSTTAFRSTSVPYIFIHSLHLPLIPLHHGGLLPCPYVGSRCTFGDFLFYLISFLLSPLYIRSSHTTTILNTPLPHGFIPHIRLFTVFSFLTIQVPSPFQYHRRHFQNFYSPTCCIYHTTIFSSFGGRFLFLTISHWNPHTRFHSTISIRCLHLVPVGW